MATIAGVALTLVALPATSSAATSAPIATPETVAAAVTVASAATVGAAACEVRLQTASAWGNSHDGVLAGRVTILGRTARVDLRHLDFAHPPAAFADASRRMWWRSMVWAVPVLSPRPATTDVQAAALLTSLMAGLDANPDPGSATRAALARSNALGWDEGTNLRREEVLNCLVWVTGGDPRVRAHLLAAVRANQDPRRYYGPPRRPVHNHGTLANLALLDTAAILGRRDLATFAVARLRAELNGVFAPGGFTYEQSTSYHAMNAIVWRRIATLLAARQDGGDVRPLLSLLARADAMTSFLTAPTGVRVPIGDGWLDQTGTPPSPQRALGATDLAGGLAAWRWSWTSPTTTYYTLRFGPRVRGHGHVDHTSFTWSTGGIPVLVDPGTFSQSAPSAYTAWQLSPAAHNVAVPAGARVVGGGSTLVSRRRVGAVDTMVVRSAQLSTVVTRTLRIDDRHRSVVVTDAGRGRLTQHFHLAPGWVVLARTARSMSFGNGHQRLLVSVRARGVSIAAVRRSVSPVAGWVFPAFEQAVPAVEILVTGTGSVTTAMVSHA